MPTSTQILPKTSFQTPKEFDYDFLIIGCSNDRCGDNAVGQRVATVVETWDLPEVRAIAVSQLIPELTTELSKTNYVIFVDACGRQNVSTVQLDPIVVYDQPPSSMAFAAHSYDPLALLNLTQRLYNYHPQAWLLQIPIESCGLNNELSSKAQRGCDRALRSIGQFLVNYRRPDRWIKAA